jgi:hypothetical protein
MDGRVGDAAFAHVMYILRSNTAKLAFCVIFKNLSGCSLGGWKNRNDETALMKVSEREEQSNVEW